ncbi:voltage-dependent calcium channel gamma-3 subunit-like [Anguilla rostrata]|uniref:voltage-dependent calcium channel gamma-3 subunit-like n=1 Tax=Anguilla rostrata TaxID=7938 RepID=UPI0030CEBD7D
MCDRGVQMLITTVGAFAAFCLMTIAVGTDYWLYSRGVCRVKTVGDNDTIRKNEEVMTHSGLWRTCCLEGTFRGICKKIDHFPQDADYEQDAAEYLLRAVRASSIFPIMSVGLLFMGGLCVAASEFYKSQHNVILSAGIFFVSAGLSNIIGIIVYISANSGDPGQSDSKKSYSYGWSFYFGALSFIMAEMVGVLAVHMFIEKHRRQRAKSRTELIKKPLSASAFADPAVPQLPLPAEAPSPVPGRASLAAAERPPPPPPSAADITMYTLSREKPPAGGPLLNSEREFLQGHDSDPPDFKEAMQSNAANRRTTPV